MNLKEAYEQWITDPELGITDRTRGLYQSCFSVMGQFWEVRDLWHQSVRKALTRDKLSALWHWLQDTQPKAAGTYALYNRILAAFQAHWVRKGMDIEKTANMVDPLRVLASRGIRKGRQTKAVPKETYEQVLKVAPMPWRLVTQLGWETGLRIIDICHLRGEEVDWDEKFIRVIPVKTRRHNKQVEIPLSDDVFQQLSEIADATMRKKSHDKGGGLTKGRKGFFFPDLHAQYHTEERKRMAADWRCACGLTRRCGMGFHSLRRSFITRLIEDDIDFSVISSMTGQSIPTLIKYIRHDINTKRKALRYV